MTSKKEKATTTGGGGGAAVLIVWLLGHFGIHVSAEMGATLALSIIASATFVAHLGLRGLARLVWRGRNGNGADH